MSKAFTREDDDRPESPVVRRPISELPPGAKNYLTVDGAERFRKELTKLAELVRPHKESNRDAAELPQGLQKLEERIRELRRILRSATVVKPPNGPPDRVRFGATVRVRSRTGEEATYRIVGIDETDPDHGWVSWLSPIAKALLNRRSGERVPFHSPSGEDELEVVSIRYD